MRVTGEIVAALAMLGIGVAAIRAALWHLWLLLRPRKPPPQHEIPRRRHGRLRWHD